MRKSALAPAAWGGLVEVDDGRYPATVSPGRKSVLSAFAKPHLPDGRSVGVHP